uniref:hypothetical protein n=1 Tax=Nonomuraea pusilla TaxID=46177 RepID=UPI00159C517F|nr:hypothetical protein [Nonomuraea pusilla]
MALACYGVGGLVGGLVTMAWRPRAVGVLAMVAMSLYAVAPLSLARRRWWGRWPG